MLPPTPSLRRAFSSTTKRLVGPESPSFIEIPTARLPNPVPKKQPKGILPTPKNLFPPSRPEKGTPKYIAAATLERRKPPSKPTDAETAAFQNWHLAMAEKRRQNLREGLRELKQRKEDLEKKRKDVLKKRNAERDIALQQAEAEDVRLTLPSVLSTMRLESKGLPDPRREERLKEMAERREQILKEKVEERQQLVHELYMNASNFILTEAELDKAIEEGFKESDMEPEFGRYLPATVREMLSRNERVGFGSPEDLGAVVLDVGGALTGGKMPASRNYMATKHLYDV
ncbi:hypothetical protein K440DRAFT_39688 [Wilcoxina mikolae CBS 423.85]|nr:hypothetical protein K440DRAFT_39688 [Wilcoxina mikolae CBS 423.85]